MSSQGAWVIRPEPSATELAALRWRLTPTERAELHAQLGKEIHDLLREDDNA